MDIIGITYRNCSSSFTDIIQAVVITVVSIDSSNLEDLSQMKKMILISNGLPPIPVKASEACGRRTIC